ncbi:Sel1 domain protein repeat-containing protein,related, related [Eimeria necatrix]|uniref:Sel1 domain protein repeat-containing protein,related, related n=1 Tax=Eimeria necatrix TaxID=51315 RepID=U6MQD5_9EIME|nr:Sel1 domain protein repeat-containing protein,related, related [Eimeria necatrix]CDJ66427.1 Sel1 domain protein repeat-containing protein,related, related [Eimeria necatrix]
MELLLSAPDFSLNPPLPLLYIYSAAAAAHPAAAAAAAWRQRFAALDGSVGQQQQACSAAANHYLPIAKATASAYASGIPQAVEVLRLAAAAAAATGAAAAAAGPTEDSEQQRLSADPEQLTMLLHEAEEGNVAVHAVLGRKYLFGTDGFPQNFAKAKYHLMAASSSWKGEAKGLLGYIYALGLGVEQDLNEAAEWFFRGATENEDPIGRV